MTKKPVRFSDLGKGTEAREHTRTPGPSSVGRSIVYISCPFCGWLTTAFLWSLAGGGKRCENTSCAALHNNYGRTLQWADVAKSSGVSLDRPTPGHSV